MSRLALLVLGAAWCAHAETALEIARKAQDRTQARSEHYEGSLEVIDAKNKVTRKNWQYDRIGSHGNSKVVLRFTAPAEVKGVALLVVNHPERASDQWMWTPALERDRRVAFQDRSTRFFGTDFSFEDLEERDISQYEYSLAGEEPVDGAPCWKLESRPRQSKSSQYTSSQIWIRKGDYVVLRIDNYRKDKLVRSLHYSEIENIQDILTPRRIEVTDFARKSRTRLETERLKYNLPMKDEDFTLQGLRRTS